MKTGSHGMSILKINVMEGIQEEHVSENDP